MALYAKYVCFALELLNAVLRFMHIKNKLGVLWSTLIFNLLLLFQTGSPPYARQFQQVSLKSVLFQNISPLKEKK